jgi:hypothetical protein
MVSGIVNINNEMPDLSVISTTRKTLHIHSTNDIFMLVIVVLLAPSSVK